MKYNVWVFLFLTLPILILSCAGLPALNAPMPTKEATAINPSSPVPAGTSSQTAPAAIGADDLKIYALFLKDAAGKTVIVREDTFTDTVSQTEADTAKYLQSQLPDVPGETINNYISANAIPGKLSSTMDLGGSYTLISTPDFLEITSQPDWRDVWKEKFPNSEVSCLVFSRIGFNNQHTQALLYVTKLWVDGGYFLMELNPQTSVWEIKNSFSNLIIN
jgi:hypothetical protein